MGDNPKWKRSTNASRRFEKKPPKYLHVSAKVTAVPVGDGTFVNVVNKGVSYVKGNP